MVLGVWDVVIIGTLALSVVFYHLFYTFRVSQIGRPTGSERAFEVRVCTNPKSGDQGSSSCPYTNIHVRGESCQCPWQKNCSVSGKIIPFRPNRFDHYFYALSVEEQQ